MEDNKNFKVNLSDEFKLALSSEYLSFFGCKNPKNGNFYVYVFSNMKEHSNKLSELEVEVWEWSES